MLPLENFQKEVCDNRGKKIIEEECMQISRVPLELFFAFPLNFVRLSGGSWQHPRELLIERKPHKEVLVSAAFVF